MLFTAPDKTYDTHNMFKILNVSLGTGFTPGSMQLEHGQSLIFSDNKLENVDRIEERNLFYCKFLSLKESSITDLNTHNL